MDDPRTPPEGDHKSSIPDPASLILEQKNTGPSPLSASRAPAAQALAAANADTHPPAAPHAPERLSDISQTPANAGLVPALQTYKGDVANVIHESRVSMADIALAAARKNKKPTEVATSGASWLKFHTGYFIEIGLGLLFIGVAIGAVLWIVMRLTPLPPAAPIQAAYVYVDASKTVRLASGETPAAVLGSLGGSLKTERLSAGLIEELRLALASTSSSVPATPLDTRGFFSRIGTHAPDSLTRSLTPQFVLGFYAEAHNAPFLIFKTDSYEQAYAGMLAWEDTLASDLTPLFIPAEEPAPAPITTVASSTAATTAKAAATSTSIKSSAPTTTPALPGLLKSPFADAVLDNHDARVLRDQKGAIVLVWAFVDRQTLVIATDRETLAELVTRVENAPTILIPH